MATDTRYLNDLFSITFVIFKDSVIFFMLSTGLLMYGQIFADSQRHYAMSERVVKMATFRVRKGIRGIFLA